MVSYTVPGVGVDATAERIATLGCSPAGTPGALDVVYTGVIEAHRKAIEVTNELDPVTQDMLIAHSGQLEQFHLFARAHLEQADGILATGNARTERSAARRASKR